MNNKLSTPAAVVYVLFTFVNQFFWAWVFLTDHVTAIRGYAVFQLVCFGLLAVYYMARGYSALKN